MLPVTIGHAQFYSGPFFKYMYIYFPSAGRRRGKVHYSVSLDTLIVFAFDVVISRAERVKVGIASAGVEFNFSNV